MAEEPAACWFTVKYDRPSADGEVLPDQQDLFNADCWAAALLDFLKERCGYNHLDEPVDLLKEDAVTCIELRSLETRDWATKLIEPKGTYVLAKVIAAEQEGGPCTYEALWTPPDGMELPPPPAAKKGK